MRGTRTCRNPNCPCPNPQPLDNFYRGKHICKVCYRAKVDAYKQAHKPEPDPDELAASRGRYSGDRRNEWDEDILLPLCSDCLLPDCIRPEGSFRTRSSHRYRGFDGCLVWACEVAKVDKAGVGEVIRLINFQPPSRIPAAVHQNGRGSHA